MSIIEADDLNRYKSFNRMNLAVIQDFINGFPFRFILVDSQHRVLLANKSTSDPHSLLPEELRGKKSPLLSHADDKECRICSREKAENSERIEETEIFIPGQNLWLNSMIFPLPYITSDGLSTFFHLAFDITDKKKSQAETLRTQDRLQPIYTGLIQVIQAIIAKRDPYIAGHQNRVAELAAAIGRNLGLGPLTTEGIRIAASIHDIGKISIPAEILARPGKLTPTEYEFIKQHPTTGYDLLKSIEFPFPIAEIIHQHHENLDGSGYPNGLKGNSIRFESRIVGLAEVVDAMSSHRPYRPAFSLEETFEEIVSKRGVVFDPLVVDTCLRLYQEEIFQFNGQA